MALWKNREVVRLPTCHGNLCERTSKRGYPIRIRIDGLERKRENQKANGERDFSRYQEKGMRDIGYGHPNATIKTEGWTIRDYSARNDKNSKISNLSRHANSAKREHCKNCRPDKQIDPRMFFQEPDMHADCRLRRARFFGCLDESWTAYRAFK